MLGKIRTRKLFIQIVLGFVILVFIAFYAGDFAMGRNDPSRDAAAVGKERVSLVEYNNMLQMIEEQQKRFFQQGETTPQMTDFFRQQAVQTLVDRKLLLIEAKKAGLKASEDEVRRKILESPYFSADGNFVGMEQYRYRVQAIFHMNVPDFEKMIAEDILVSKLDDLLTAGILVSDQEIEDDYRKTNLTAKIDFVKFADETTEVPVTPEEARAYYDSHKEEFATGELRKVQYLWISSSSDKNRVQIPEQELRQYYDKNAERFSKPEQVHARHILLKIDGKNEEEVKKQAEDLVKQLRAGADFAALAQKYSDDPGSKARGGDLGFFSKGRMIPEFEKAAFSLKVNEISDPIKSQFGYHIIQVLEKQPAYKMDFAMVKDQIYRELAQPKAIENAKDQATKIKEDITQNKKSLSDISKIQLVDLKTTDFFSKDQDLPGLSPSFRDETFNLKKGEISDPVQVFQDFAIIQLLDTKPSEIQPFEKVQAKATDQVRDQKIAEASKEKAQKFYDSLAGATDLKAAAEKEKLEVKTTEPFSNQGFINEIPNGKEVSEMAFAMKVGEISKPVKTDDGYIVFQLKEKKDFDPAEFAKAKDSLRQQLANQKENEFVRDYRDMLRKRYQKEIWINDKLVTSKET
jgi:peptidyl-prolyl cis-trans isomerase D